MRNNTAKKISEQTHEPKNCQAFSDTSYKSKVLIRNIWVRHAQKSSMVVYEDGEISKSKLSRKGEKLSEEFGKRIKALKHGLKGYSSPSERTEQTLSNIIQGYKISNPSTVVRMPRKSPLLLIRPPREFVELFDEKYRKNLKRKTEELGKEFDELDLDAQERISELAEEEVIKEWLEDENSKLAQLYPPRKAASYFAVYFNRFHERLAKRLRSGSEVDIIHVMHKTSTEPFLCSGVLIDKETGKRVTSLEDIGGSLATLECWTSYVVVCEGTYTILVELRGRTYVVDKKVLDELVKNARFSLG